MTAGRARDGGRVDAVIVGAGAAGLSLAAHLAHAGWGRDVVVVDDASLPLDGRAWAWWSTGEGLLDDAATAAVDRLAAAGPGWATSASLAPYTYRTITGPALAAASDRLTARHPRYRRLRGTARAIARDGDGARVDVDLPGPGGGRVTLRAAWVFDSVGPGTPRVDTRAAPHLDFLGVHVETDRECFDARTVTFMDLRTDQSDGVAFVYVLPSGPRTALVERTVVAHPGSRTPRPRPAHDDHVTRYLRDVLGVAGHRIVATESGAIPLRTRAAAVRDGPVVPIGTRAGMVKASTGYGFARIQRHSAAIARGLVTRGRPGAAGASSAYHRTLDAALLRVIRDDPGGARAILSAMLRRNAPARVLEFLDEDASPSRQLGLFLTLPFWIFLRPSR